MKTSGNQKKTFYEELQGTTDEIIRQVKRLIKEGNARRLMIENKDGKILFQTQLTAGLTGTALITMIAPVISALGMIALVMNDVKVVVERYPAEQLGKDKYEVEGEIIVEVEDEEEKESENKKTSKTVGRGDDE
ncbi:MAG TPA: DUF4342 domain-containing protein [Balneolaceae bacterium]|nr:DUF4342 domain-containing protein [Balneolaceae bacterium]